MRNHHHKSVDEPSFIIIKLKSWIESEAPSKACPLFISMCQFKFYGCHGVQVELFQLLYRVHLFGARWQADTSQSNDFESIELYQPNKDLAVKSTKRHVWHLKRNNVKLVTSFSGHAVYLFIYLIAKLNCGEVLEYKKLLVRHVKPSGSANFQNKLNWE